MNTHSDQTMWNFSSAILGLIFMFLLQANNAEGKCVLKIKPINQPLIIQKFGSKQILLTNLEKQVDVGDNAQIQAFCASGFKSFNVISTRSGYRQEINYDIKNKRSLSFKCISSTLHVFEEKVNIIPKFEENSMLDYQLGCSGSVYSMYESLQKLPNCNDLSYALGAKLTTPIILAGLCYDLDGSHLKYISYKLHKPFTMLEKAQHYYPEGLNSLAEPLLPIEYFYPFLSQANITDYINGEAINNFWLRIACYELDNIVQTVNSFRIILDEFQNFFNIIWWSNLRAGNWRRFMDLLEKRSENVNYNIYTGTSNNVRVPMVNNCENETNLSINYKGSKRTVPEFIWAYLKSFSEYIIEDFVVIAYNSPYFENFDKSSTVLCSDICDEIDWLTPLKDSRHVSTLGVLYCCRPETVADLLDGFPCNKHTVITTTVEPEKNITTCS